MLIYSTDYEYYDFVGDRVGKYKWSATYIPIGVRGAWHYNWDVDKLDTYAGVGLGYMNVAYKTDNDAYKITNKHSSVYSSAFAGAAYYFSKGFGLFAELGYDISNGTIGISLKF